MSADEQDKVYITTLWGKNYSVARTTYKYYESFIHAVTQSKALVREACEENGGLAENDVDDTRSELDKAVGKGICCTGVQFEKRPGGT